MEKHFLKKSTATLLLGLTIAPGVLSNATVFAAENAPKTVVTASTDTNKTTDQKTDTKKVENAFALPIYDLHPKDDASYEKAVKTYQEALAIYNKAESARAAQLKEKEAAQKEFELAKEKYKELKDAYDKAVIAKKEAETRNAEKMQAYEKAMEVYKEKLAAYEATVAANQKVEAANKETAQKNKDALAAYESALAKFKADEAAYNKAVADSKKADEEYAAAMKAFEPKKAEFEKANKAYEESKKATDSKEDGSLKIFKTQSLNAKTANRNAKVTVQGGQLRQKSEFYNGKNLSKSMPLKAAASIEWMSSTEQNPLFWQKDYKPSDISGVNLKNGESATITYEGLTGLDYAGKKITKLTYKVTATDGDGVAYFFKDPIMDSLYPVGFTPRVEVQYFGEDGKPIVFNAENPAIISFSSINHNEGGKETVKLISGVTPIEINGSSVTNHSGEFYSDKDNANKAAGSRFDGAEYDYPNSGKEWYASAAGELSGDKFVLEFTSSGKSIWFNINSDVKAKNLLPKPAGVTPPTKRVVTIPPKPVAPKEPQQLSGNTITPVEKPVAPEKPELEQITEPVLPTEPVLKDVKVMDTLKKPEAPVKPEKKELPKTGQKVVKTGLMAVVIASFAGLLGYFGLKKHKKED